ncbi:hypothetical protein MMC26_007440 [Xylographa opegraphella]|nr:hypothetical protein [Xylographa opegraphella]
MAQQMKLAGKHVIVTGASRGIGLAIARLFATHGVERMILVGRSDALNQASEAISQDTAIEVKIAIGDVKRRSFWMDIGYDMRNVDILVNAAGVAHSSLLVTTKCQTAEHVIQTNLMGSIWGCQIIGKAMMRQCRKPSNTACIINVASLLGVKGGRGSTVYAASKAGVLGLTRSLAAELGPSNIRVNAIVPGYVETSMTEGRLNVPDVVRRKADLNHNTAMTKEARSAALQSIPQERFGTPDEIADAAMFLATNAYANNCVLNLDGGLSAT